MVRRAGVEIREHDRVAPVKLGVELDTSQLWGLSVLHGAHVRLVARPGNDRRRHRDVLHVRAPWRRLRSADGAEQGPCGIRHRFHAPPRAPKRQLPKTASQINGRHLEDIIRAAQGLPARAKLSRFDCRRCRFYPSASMARAVTPSSVTGSHCSFMWSMTSGGTGSSEAWLRSWHSAAGVWSTNASRGTSRSREILSHGARRFLVVLVASTTTACPLKSKALTVSSAFAHTKSSAGGWWPRPCKACRISSGHTLTHPVTCKPRAQVVLPLLGSPHVIASRASGTLPPFPKRRLAPRGYCRSTLS